MGTHRQLGKRGWVPRHTNTFQGLQGTQWAPDRANTLRKTHRVQTHGKTGA